MRPAGEAILFSTPNPIFRMGITAAVCLSVPKFRSDKNESSEHKASKYSKESFEEKEFKDMNSYLSSLKE